MKMYRMTSQNSVDDLNVHAYQTIQNMLSSVYIYV